jgi:predicted DNA-binding transcriptional regulator YafY
MRLFRLFRLLDKLRVRTQPITALELSGLMGVSLRTIYRDIADLQSLGAPIRGEGGIGFVMEKGFFLPSLNFESDELEALALGAKLVAARTGDGAHRRRSLPLSAKPCAKSFLRRHLRQERALRPLTPWPGNCRTGYGSQFTAAPR